MFEKIYDLDKGDALPEFIPPQTNGKKWLYFEMYDKYKNRVFIGKCLVSPEAASIELADFFYFKEDITPRQEVWIIVSKLGKIGKRMFAQAGIS